LSGRRARRVVAGEAKLWKGEALRTSRKNGISWVFLFGKRVLMTFPSHPGRGLPWLKGGLFVSLRKCFWELSGFREGYKDSFQGKGSNSE